MQSEQKLIDQAVDQAKSYRLNCMSMEMRKQVYQLSQMLRMLLYFIALNPLSPHLDPIHCVISEVSWTLYEALSLACKCRRKTIFCRLFIASKATSFHKLYHLLDLCIANMNWLILIYNPDFGSAFNEIFLSLPHILTNDSSIPLAWPCMVTEDNIRELATVLRRLDFGGIINCRILVKEIEKAATEAVVVLQKFARKHNYLHKAHSKRMIEFNANAVQALVKLLMRDGERTQQLHDLVLIWHIATNADYSEAIEEARLVTAIEHLLEKGDAARRVETIGFGLQDHLIWTIFGLVRAPCKPDLGAGVVMG
ncbi:hypothetical protein PTKIN_Ptkin02bG0244100 [Pterospermum kingtungense]